MKTRLAPSPTGALHLGNAFAFVFCWVAARANGWRVVLRIEDLDGPRLKPGAADEAIDLLAWLGLDWDEGPLWQRADLAPYEEALERLDVYACDCTRRDIALSAPNEGDRERRYPGTCRGRAGRGALRFRVPDGPIAFRDAWRGDLSRDVQAQVGDFVVRTKSGLPAYQLAVVVDDARQGITQVIRGCDLLDSTARQVLLYGALGLTPPTFTHLPLVRGPDGLRLAKRHGDTRLKAYRALGVSRERVLGLLGFWARLWPERREASPAELRFERMAFDSISFTAQDDVWLRGVA